MRTANYERLPPLVPIVHDKSALRPLGSPANFSTLTKADIYPSATIPTWRRAEITCRKIWSCTEYPTGQKHVDLKAELGEILQVKYQRIVGTITSKYHGIQYLQLQSVNQFLFVEGDESERLTAIRVVPTFTLFSAKHLNTELGLLCRSTHQHSATDRYEVSHTDIRRLDGAPGVLTYDLTDERPDLFTSMLQF